jgi:hypothetical protein
MLIATTAVLGAVGIAGCGGQTSEVVATVAGAKDGSITLAQVDRWRDILLKSEQFQTPTAPDPPNFSGCAAARRRRFEHVRLPAAGLRSQLLNLGHLRHSCASDYAGLRQQALGFLVTAVWVHQAAADRGLTLTGTDLASATQQVEQQLGVNSAVLTRYLMRVGMTSSEFEYRVQTYALATKMGTTQIAAPPAPSAARIATYYAQHRSELIEPERRDLLAVVTGSRGNALTALTRLRHGQSFAQVVNALSIDPVTRAKGGRITGFMAGSGGDPIVQRAIFSARPGVLTGPVLGASGVYAVFEVTHVDPPQQLTLRQATPVIVATLTAPFRTRAQRAFAVQLTAIWKHRTTCLARFATSDCGRIRRRVQ